MTKLKLDKEFGGRVLMMELRIGYYICYYIRHCIRYYIPLCLDCKFHNYNIFRNEFGDVGQEIFREVCQDVFQEIVREVFQEVFQNVG